MDKSCLIIIDMLNDFIQEDAPLRVPEIETIIEPIKREIQKARMEYYPIIYLCDSHDKDDREFKLFQEHAVKGTKGASIIDELRPQGSDIIIRKNAFSGFYKTELEEVLKRMSIKKLIITGCVINICVLYTVADAVMRGFEVDVVMDAVKGLSKNDTKFAIKQMRDILKVNIV